MAIRTVLIDDHRILREGLRALIDNRESIEVVGEAVDGPTGVRLVAELHPDVVLLDLNMPTGSGLDCVKDILAAEPQTHILVLTMHSVAEYVLQAFAAGVLGYAVKSQPAEEVLEAIHAVARGDRYLAPELPRALLESSGKASGGVMGLSPREQQIFDLAVKGFTNEGIGEHLGISVKTVETHRAHVNRKLGVHSAAELIRFAARRGLVV